MADRVGTLNWIEESDVFVEKDIQPEDFYAGREEAEHRIQRVRKAIMEGMRNDPRFRRLVDSCASEARHEHGPVDPEHADRAANEYATFAAAMMLARIYDEDGELAAMRAERDNYKALAENAFAAMPTRFVIPKP